MIPPRQWCPCGGRIWDDRVLCARCFVAKMDAINAKRRGEVEELGNLIELSEDAPDRADGDNGLDAADQPKP